MTTPPSYRQLAERSLSQAAGALNQIPQGRVIAAEVQSRAATAQALGTVAVAQALLDLADAVRETPR